jgi:hypothetical protein
VRGSLKCLTSCGDCEYLCITLEGPGGYLFLR